MILVIDNYDSFTYNLVQVLLASGVETRVFRNDRISPAEVEAMSPEAILLSPGPCTPKEAGITVEIVRTFYRKLPMLGVCLGHQAIGYAFGGRVVRADRVMHGKTSPIRSDGETLFKGIPEPFHGGSLPLPDPRSSVASLLFRGHGRDGGGRDHGDPSPGVPCRGDTVSPGIGPDPAGEEDYPEFFGSSEGRIQHSRVASCG